MLQYGESLAVVGTGLSWLLLVGSRSSVNVFLYCIRLHSADSGFLKACFVVGSAADFFSVQPSGRWLHVYAFEGKVYSCIPASICDP